MGAGARRAASTRARARAGALVRADGQASAARAGRRACGRQERPKRAGRAGGRSAQGAGALGGTSAQGAGALGGTSAQGAGALGGTSARGAVGRAVWACLCVWWACCLGQLGQFGFW